MTYMLHVHICTYMYMVQSQLMIPYNVSNPTTPCGNVGEAVLLTLGSLNGGRNRISQPEIKSMFGAQRHPKFELVAVLHESHITPRCCVCMYSLYHNPEGKKQNRRIPLTCHKRLSQSPCDVQHRHPKTCLPRAELLRTLQQFPQELKHRHLHLPRGQATHTAQL